MNLQDKKIVELFKNSFTGSKYYKELLLMEYEDALAFLKKKNGIVKYNFFEDESFEVVNKKNYKKNLIIHHDFSNKAIFLNYSSVAKQFPKEYQENKNLTYCTILEYMIINFLIMIDNQLNYHDSNVHIPLGYLNIKGILFDSEYLLGSKECFEHDIIDKLTKKTIKRERKEYLKIFSMIITFLSFSVLYSQGIDTTFEEILTNIDAFIELRIADKYLSEILPEIRLFLEEYDKKLVEDKIIFNNKKDNTKEYLKYIITTNYPMTSFTYVKFLYISNHFLYGESLFTREYKNLIAKIKKVAFENQEFSKIYGKKLKFYEYLIEIIKDEIKYLYDNFSDEDN